MTPGPDAIALVGLACRFPGAPDADRFGEVLFAGRETIRRFALDEVLRAGVARAVAERPDFVPCAGVLDDPARFDADAFGFSARDAELIDPQQRHFLECAALALDDAALGHTGPETLVGVYAGADTNTYLLSLILADRALVESYGGFATVMANDKDFIATRVAYKLGLTGPCMSVQSACSTSLLAVAVACQALADHQCDVALAGGATVRVPAAGYVYEPGGIHSPDGTCRAFDRAAQGTVSSSGVGAVALCRLEDALAQGLPIRATIAGWAVSNDGADRVSFSAPAARGQAAAIRGALAQAEIGPGDLSYVEAHGTGTPVGDAIEIQALTAVLGETARDVPCMIGSVKTNIGHAGAAAGIAGLIKTVLSLERRRIAPHLHFAEPHPALRFDERLLRVPTVAAAWEPGPGGRRWAGVSSFGIGGTNVHVVLTDAPEPAPARSQPPGPVPVLVSARSAAALERSLRQQSAALSAAGSGELAAAARTLALGRRALDVRWGAAARDPDAARAALARAAPRAPRDERALVYLLPGQGTQRFGMFRAAYDALPNVRRALDEIADRFAAHELDVRTAAGWRPAAADDGRLDGTADAQAALFTVAVGLGQALAELGLRPAALLGHSIGELAAATLAGVFSLDDAVAVVAARGRAMAAMPPGRMVAVAGDRSAWEALVPAEVAFAAHNAPWQTAIGGPPSAVAAFTAALERVGIPHRMLPSSLAFHTPMMEPAAARLEAAVREAALRPPQTPVLSNVSGSWLTAQEATDPHYWARQIVAPVRFGDCVRTVLARGPVHALELGPGAVLSGLVQGHAGPGAGADVTVHPVGATAGAEPDALLDAVIDLWSDGREVDWGAWPMGEGPRARLPGYPFGGRRYWVGGAATDAGAHPPQTEPAGEPVPARAAGAAAHPRPPLATPFVEPAGEEERQLAELWSETLGVAPIGRDDDFAELGGQSLAAIRLAARIHEKFLVRVPVRIIFESATLREMAAAIDRVTVETADSAELAAYAEPHGNGATAPSPPVEARGVTEWPRHAGDGRPRAGGPALSLFFFAGAQADGDARPYDLLERCAQFADESGLEAVWVPDRHFHHVGGLYPNPALLAAALATKTRRIGLRAGSVVLPARHPVGVAEEWSVVDNLSGGRAGIALASGFHPLDFAMRPENYVPRAERLLEGIASLRRLWSGGAADVTDGNGRPAQVFLFPRPVQPELPLWITSGGSPSTFETAGRLGTRVLTAPLQIDLGGLEERIALYYRAYETAWGTREGAGVTVMLHAYVGEDDRESRRIVREPFMSFLRGHAELARSLVVTTSAASAADVERLGPGEVEDVLNHAFERFYAGASLMGAPEKCRAVIERLTAAGVTEIAALADFGLTFEQIVRSTQRLRALAGSS